MVVSLVGVMWQLGEPQKVTPTEISVAIYIAGLELTAYGKADNNPQLFS